ncbi:MAG: nickel transporter [Methylobacter sp.]|nr:MAG: nickel transporter [Methylobacter sp.]PPD18981.1 MAG: nickel transporter [Methylobacter sp.]PPD37452.1 MAG: nickel transporter [Methylomonas sp.]
MKVIPVIDLKNGQVVRAEKGRREQYAPWQDSLLCTSADVFEVIEAFLACFPFDTFYLADLDAITLNQNQTWLIEKILKKFPDLGFWVDAGYPLSPLLTGYKNYMPVLGSESLNENNHWPISNLPKEFILSLDYLNNSPLGAEMIFQRHELWPQKIIVMVLDKVGSGLGPDFYMLQQMLHNHPGKTFIAAGGIRNLSDLEHLSKLGIKQALVASALHHGQLKAEDLRLAR